MLHTNTDWDMILKNFTDSSAFRRLMCFLDEEYAQKTVYPARADLYNALRYTPYASVRVVILGQDPYHQPGQAQGLAFSVPQGVAAPPSLLNIFKEIAGDTGAFRDRTRTDLRDWAQQGVLLLNAVLSVREGEPNAHRGMGWEQFTDEIICQLDRRTEPVVFLLWGKNAQEKRRLIHAPRHLVLTAPHPSPLSAFRGFFGCKHFSRVNQFLAENGQPPIRWA